MRYTTKPSKVNAVYFDGTFAAIEEIAKAFPDLPMVWTSITSNPVVALQIQAGVDGAQGMVPVPSGHYVVSTDPVSNDYWPVERSYFESKYEVEA